MVPADQTDSFRILKGVLSHLHPPARSGQKRMSEICWIAGIFAEAVECHEQSRSVPERGTALHSSKKRSPLISRRSLWKSASHSDGTPRQRPKAAGHCVVVHPTRLGRNTDPVRLEYRLLNTRRIQWVSVVRQGNHVGDTGTGGTRQFDGSGSGSLNIRDAYPESPAHSTRRDGVEPERATHRHD